MAEESESLEREGGMTLRLSMLAFLLCLSGCEAVHEKSLRHVRFVRVQVDEFPRSKNSCGKQNGELSLLGHTGTPVFCGMNFR